MTWLNEGEIEDMAERYATHELLGPATSTLKSLMLGTNRCSDGWPYWRKPTNAARQLQELIAPTGWHRMDAARPDVTADRLKKAYATLRRFRTAHPVCRFLIYAAPGVPGDDPPAAEWERHTDGQGRTGWFIAGYDAQPGWLVTDEGIRERGREAIEAMFRGLPPLPAAAWAVLAEQVPITMKVSGTGQVKIIVDWPEGPVKPGRYTGSVTAAESEGEWNG